MNNNAVPTTRAVQAGGASPAQATLDIEKRPVGPSSDHSGNKPSASPPTKPFLEIELAEMGRAWRKYRSINDRDAVYIYLASVFGIVMRWRLLDSAPKKSRAALRLRPNPPQMKPEAFSILIFCTADPNVVDAKTRSKWSRVLRYAARAKPAGQRLTDFVKFNGGLNECARKFARVPG
jgi:hypothetical protein